MLQKMSRCWSLINCVKGHVHLKSRNNRRCCCWVNVSNFSSGKYCTYPILMTFCACALIDSTVTHIIMHTLIIYVYIDHARTRTHLHTHTCNIVCNTIYIWYICMYAVWHVYPLYNVCVAASCRPFFFPLRLPAYVCVFLCFYMLLFHLNYLTIIMTFGKAAMASITWHKDLPWK